MDVPEEKRKLSFTTNQINAVAANVKNLDRVSPNSNTSEDAPMCWICLDSGGTLVNPCNCPRYVHPRCLARWQLQSAGSQKETHCEFCRDVLPDWKQTLTPFSGTCAPAVMNVNFDGRTYSFEVKPGIDGYRSFTEAIRKAFSLPDDSELNITFTCDEPSTDAGSLLTLQGAGAYDAAVHCASVSAARRLNTPGPSRTTSLDESQALSAMTETVSSGPSLTQSQHSHPNSPRSRNQLRRHHLGSSNSGGSGSLGDGAPLTPEQSRQLDLANRRRLGGFGKRIKTALTEFLR